jgi:CDP-glucose 4,6-dehydratase
MRDQDERSALSRSGDLGRVDVVRGSLERYLDVERALAESGSSVVFHLGAQTIVGVGVHAPLLTFESNIRGTYNVLEACRRHPSIVERVVIASSDKAYGSSDRPYDEGDPLRPTSPYDVSKAAGDLLAQSYHATYGLRVAILRCGNTYGGGDLNWSRLIPGTIRSFHHGEAPEIRSDGTFVRDYIHVSDVAEAYSTAAEALDRADVVGQAFNIAAGTRATVIEIVHAIADLMGGELPEPRVLGVAHDEIREQRLSTDKVQRVIGWVPKVGLTEGLRDTIAWYRSYLGASS